MKSIPGNSVAVMVFTRDLRVTDNPALAAAVASSAQVLPLFVIDPDAEQPDPDRRSQTAFLLDSLRDLDVSLRTLGGRLIVRAGRWVDEVLHAVREVGADQVHLTDDVSGSARQRLNLLADEAAALRFRVVRHPGMTVVPAGQLAPSGGAEYKVFGAYHRAWTAATWRPAAPRPAAITLPESLFSEVAPLHLLTTGAPPPPAAVGGESAGTHRLREWTAEHLDDYADIHDDLAADATSRISPYLHFGCLAPRQLASELIARPGGEAFVRQLCWRDFFYQVLAARPDAASVDYRDRGDRWQTDDDMFDAWREGRTGYPVVDAGMRQLIREGFMHNRARMIVASFLTKDLYCDWRLGASHFMSLLVDADLALNQLNWQWIAGTGTDSNPHRIFNPTVQGRRFDPEGVYVRRYLPELAGVSNTAIHDPDPDTRRLRGYPAPVVDHAEAITAYRARPRN